MDLGIRGKTALVCGASGVSVHAAACDVTTAQSGLLDGGVLQ